MSDVYKNICGVHNDGSSSLDIGIDNNKIIISRDSTDNSVSIKNKDGTLSDIKVNRIQINQDPVNNNDGVNKKYVDNEVAAIVGGAPEQLNALNELATALGNDENFAATVASELGNKVNKVDGKDLSTNDYTTEEKTKLANLEAYVMNAIASQATETWTFTLSDGSTVTKNVVIK